MVALTSNGLPLAKAESRIGCDVLSLVRVYNAVSISDTGICADAALLRYITYAQSFSESSKTVDTLYNHAEGLVE
jgi:hypothetical protein